jgi:hypothetical protein
MGPQERSVFLGLVGEILNNSDYCERLITIPDQTNPPNCSNGYRHRAVAGGMGVDWGGVTPVKSDVIFKRLFLLLLTALHSFRLFSMARKLVRTARTI